MGGWYRGSATARLPASGSLWQVTFQTTLSRLQPVKDISVVGELLFDLLKSRPMSFVGYASGGIPGIVVKTR